MSEDTKQMIVFVVGLVSLAGVIAFGGARCEAQKHEAQRDDNAALVRCVEAGRDPLECRAVIEQ